MVQLTTKYAGLTLRNPLIIGSSGLTDSAKKIKELENAGAGAVILKSLFEEQIEMQSDTLMQGSDLPEAEDYIRTYAKSHHLEQYISTIREAKALCSIPVIASINCYKADSWVEYARKLEDAGADAIELNIFYLCTDVDTLANEMYDLYISILKKIKKHVSLPVTIKIGKGFSNIPGLVNQLKLHDAGGIVLFNRFYQTDINIDKIQVTSGQVFSNPYDLSDTLRWTALVSGFVPGISIASSRGVHEWEDAVKCILAGAQAIQICSTVYKNGKEVIQKILSGIESWMNEKKYQSISEFCGKLNFSNTEDPSVYERAQFMKYFSNKS